MNNIKYSTQMIPKKNPWKPWILFLILIFLVSIAIFPEFYGKWIGIWFKKLTDAFNDSYYSNNGL